MIKPTRIIPPKNIRGDEFRDCTHIFVFGLFLFFAPKLRAMNASIGLRERAAERARTQTLQQLSNLLFLLSEVE